jgi:hypothetical protein
MGMPCAVIHRETCQIISSGYQARPQLLRANSSPVDAAPFLQPGVEHVTGVLVASADAANCLDPLGRDFMVLPNLFGAPAYTSGQIQLGQEYRVEVLDTGGWRVAAVTDYSTPVTA